MTESAFVGSTLEPVPEPRRLGRYDIVAKIASGGMATVYVGRATGAAGFERLVAIKCCHPHLRDDPEFRNMFLDEARLAAFIHHPNVVPTVDVQDGEVLFLVMEYVEGGRLAELISAARTREEQVPLDVAVRVLCDILQGLHAAHTQAGPDGAPLHIVHRDVSPQNLLVGVDGVSRVVDFGVAKAEARATITTDQRLKGKLRYMSPEQVGGLGLSCRSDLFSAGVVLWETLTGDRLFHGDTPADLAQQIVFVPIRHPSTRRDGIPPELEAIVMRALARNPADRFASALEMATALESAGVTPASHRRVGDYVVEALGPRIERRRDLLRQSRRTRDAAVRLAEERRTEEPSGSGVTVTSPGPRRGRRLTLVLVVLTALGVTLWLAWPRVDARDVALPGGGTAFAPTEPVPTLPGETHVRDVASEGEAAPLPEAEAAPTLPEPEVAPSRPPPEPRLRRERSRRPGPQRERAPTKDEPYRPDRI